MLKTFIRFISVSSLNDS